MLNNFTLVQLCNGKQCIIVAYKDPETYYGRPSIGDEKNLNKIH